jgi:hypothetical protein
MSTSWVLSSPKEQTLRVTKLSSLWTCQYSGGQKVERVNSTGDHGTTKQSKPCRSQASQPLDTSSGQHHLASQDRTSQFCSQGVSLLRTSSVSEGVESRWSESCELESAIELCMRRRPFFADRRTRGVGGYEGSRMCEGFYSATPH